MLVGRSCTLTFRLFEQQTRRAGGNTPEGKTSISLLTPGLMSTRLPSQDKDFRENTNKKRSGSSRLHGRPLPLLRLIPSAAVCFCFLFPSDQNYFLFFHSLLIIHVIFYFFHIHCNEHQVQTDVKFYLDSYL